MVQSNKFNVDYKKIDLAIHSGFPLAVTMHSLTVETEEYIINILSSLLQKLNQEYFIDGLTYCIKELLYNAEKANLKRIFFLDKHLDINDNDDYKTGMKTFKQEVFGGKTYSEKQTNKSFYVKIIFQIQDKKIKIEIKNNSEINLFEKAVMQKKLEQAKYYATLENPISKVIDDSEGAGLGLILVILILKKNGLSEDNFESTCQNGETINSLSIPLSENITTKISSISKEFIDFIEGLPEFPENISQINSLINSKNASINDIATKISNDVSLTAELFKMVNSATYVLQQPCKSIFEAIKFIGLRGLRNLLFSIGSMRFLVIKSSEKNKKVWARASKVAFYSYNLAKNFCKNLDKSCIEDSYVCGLLHDMGIVVFENIHPNMLKKISELCEKRNIPTQSFEDLAVGLNHAEIGALIAEKWNFPQVFIDVIRFHHNPHNAPEKNLKLTKIVYLADVIADYNDKAIEFEQIDKLILDEFDITSESYFKGLASKLAESFMNK